MKSIFAHVLVLTIVALSLAALSFVASGCGPKQGTADETAFTSAPVDVRAEVNDGSMRVFWNLRGNDRIAGYNIYISQEPLAKKYPNRDLPKSIQAHNTSPYPGDTNPDDGVVWYQADGLDNGVKYYVSVRAVYSNWTLSRPSAEIVAVCGPRGSFELAVRYKGSPGGFSFTDNSETDADASNNDLYFYSQGGTDYLAAPSRLDGYLRASRLTVLPYKGELSEVAAKVMASPVTGGSDRVEVAEGNWVLIETAGAGHALVHVDKVAGTGDDRRISLTFAFSPLHDEIFF